MAVRKEPVDVAVRNVQGLSLFPWIVMSSAHCMSTSKNKETEMKRLLVWLPLILFIMLGGHFASAKDGRETNQGSQGNAAAPQFKVDADWPKPLPNQWLLGQVAG